MSLPARLCLILMAVLALGAGQRQDSANQLSIHPAVRLVVDERGDLHIEVRAAGGELSDIVQVTRFVVDIGGNQVAINAVMNRYWGNHRPASTSVEIVRLATDPRFILEVEAVAVISD